MMSRDQIVRELALDLKGRVQVIKLKRMAEETAELYDDLIRHKVPSDVVRGYFVINWMRERNEEERQRGQRG